MTKPIKPVPVIVFIVLGLGLSCLLSAAVVAWRNPDRRQRSDIGCTEFDHHDRKLPNSYRLRVMVTCVYRVKWGSDHVVLPMTDRAEGTHGILEVAIVGNTVIGPVIDSSTPVHALVGWFWLDTQTREFKESLTKEEVGELLRAKGLKMPVSLTPVGSLPDYPWGD